ncbi:MAG: hypothetical protein P0Y65_05675 [Candidatus Devosia phytovorans]|uniref:Uncharacterized protein n=1 Tax=Candidatus Devosia phytovorans TaxID=3121372 RepID=A0AAJ5VVV4_9HYPH|nr:hypothetical protein [Devosia sp.]WEK05744.1 MAG: hypothetical protein P0Y65_05675 [Devosia sp.]
MTYRIKNPGVGTDFKGMKQISVGFDPETFAQVRSIAVSEGCSMAEAIRTLVEFGLLDMAEAA